MPPLAIDLFCGLGGWTDGLLAEGYDVIGFDIERHEYGNHCYPALLVVKDVRTLHGSQFKDAALIVASPPCQEYSYMAMPWKLAKAKAAAGRKKSDGGSWFGDYAAMKDGIKQGGDWFNQSQPFLSRISSKSPKRKAASAMIAKIPLPLSRHIAATFR